MGEHERKGLSDDFEKKGVAGDFDKKGRSDEGPDVEGHMFKGLTDDVEDDSFDKKGFKGRKG
jgi:hypothetical protein